MKTPKMPAAPDPWATAAAQGAFNKDTAISQSMLNMVDQITPHGTLTYEKVGDWAPSPNGGRPIANTGQSGIFAGMGGAQAAATGTPGAGIPHLRARVTLTPEQQALLNQEQEFDRRFNDIALQQTNAIGAHLAKPLDLSNEATEARLMELGRKRLDPVFAERKAATEADLQARGIGMGTEAYDREMRKLGESNNDALTQLLLSGRGQAVQEALTARNQPINEITALMNGGQVSQPNFINTPQSAIANTDYIGAAQMKQNADMAQWQAKQQNRQAMMSGLFQLGSAALGGWGYGGFKGIGS